MVLFLRVTVNHAAQTEIEVFLSVETSSHSDDELKCLWLETDMKVSVELFVGITGLNIVIDNINSFTEEVLAAIGDELIQLFTDQSISTTEVKKFVSLLILMGQVGKDRFSTNWLFPLVLVM
jgi:predicted transglutaminase-like protease